MLRRSVEVTDVNAAVFDAANGFAGCIRRPRKSFAARALLEGTWCLNPNETLSPGQAEESTASTTPTRTLTTMTLFAKTLDQWLRA